MIKLILHPNDELEQSVELESRTILIGRSDENDLTIDDASVASHHVRIEKRGEQFIVKDLSKQGILVDGEKVREAEIAVGSIIALGDVDILFKGETAVAVDEDGVLVAEDGVVIGEVEAGPEAGALITTPQGVGSGSYLPTETFIQPAHIEPERSVASTLPLISFISGALGPLLIGIGWLLGIILGFVSLANIRRRGGLLKDKRMAQWGINLGFLWVVIVFALVAWRTWVGGVGYTIRANQLSARHALEGICATEYYVRHGHFIDADADGMPEYATREQLELNTYSAMPDLDRELRGYTLVIERANEDGFLCYAEPKAYGRTGRLTYSIDERGILRGEDLHGASFAESDGELRTIGEGKSVIETAGEQIAGDLVDAAVRAFEQAVPTDDKAGYERALRIIDETRDRFPTTQVVERQLDMLSEEIGPRIAEVLALEQYNTALALVEQNEIVRALRVLQDAEHNFSTTSYVEKIRDEIALIKAVHLKTLEADAERVFSEAQRLELAGDFTAAKQQYQQIKERYSITTYGQGIDERIDKVTAKIHEAKAEEYIAQLRELRPDTDYVTVNDIVGVLKRNYARTEAYERNYEMIALAEHRALAYSLAARAGGHIGEEQYESALTLLDEAIAEYPDIQTRLQPQLETCLIKTGGNAYTRQDFRTALTLFKRYADLPPKQNVLPQKALMHAYFEVGKLDYQQGQYKAAEQKLLACSGLYERHPEFNYIYGSVLVEIDDHRRAIEYFSRYFANKNADPNGRFYAPSLRKRGYAHTQVAAQLEAEVKQLVMVNVVYRPLLDTDAIETPPDRGGQSTGEENGGDTNSNDEDDEDDEDDDDITDAIDRVRTDPAPDSLILLAQAETDAGDGGEAGQPERQPAVRRILDLIVEMREAEAELKKEHRAATGDPARRDSIKIKRTQHIEFFQQKLANLRIDILRENTSKAEIIQRLYLATQHIGSGVADLRELMRVSSRNRDLERVISHLEYKGRMFAAAYQNLRQAAEQDAKSQRDAYTLLNRALDELRGWHTGRDIGETLRAMYMMKPGTENVSEGLRALLKGIDVETDLGVILRVGGEPGA